MLKSIINIFFINFLILKNNQKKVIFFYFPRNDLTLKDVKYIKYCFTNFRKNKFFIIFGHNNEKLKKRSFYYINQKFLVFLKNIDIFISNYICNKFPGNSKKIYLHHCIYDTPLTGRNNEKKTFNAILNYDYIFLPSNKIIKSFSKYFKIKKEEKIKFLSSGYPRLDYLNKNSKKMKKNAIIIAIANFLAYPTYTIIKKILPIIREINLKFNYDIIIRPHPANRNIFNEKNFFELFDEIKKNSNIKIDINDDYLYSYNKSIIMITDLSGTAYTFSFLTNSPVLFFSINEKKTFKDYSKLNHFTDRKKIGDIVTNINNLEKKIKKLIKNRKKYKKNILILKKNKLDFYGVTQKRFYNLINSISN